VQTKETKRNKVLEAIRERSDSQKSNIWVILLGHTSYVQCMGRS